MLSKAISVIRDKVVMDDHLHLSADVAEDIVTLLKENHDHTPVLVEGKKCPRCRYKIPRYMADYPQMDVAWCPYCGQAVKWDA